MNGVGRSAEAAPVPREPRPRPQFRRARMIRDYGDASAAAGA